jgi:MFS family permease
LAQLQVYGIFAAGYLARPLGGIVMAHFGDRSGRKRMFTLSVFLMALPTLCIGLLPTYAQLGALAPVLLLVLRVMQGLAIGGEVPGAWVFVAEHAPPGRVGLACGSITSGLTLGILMGSLVATGISSMSEEKMLAYGWRIPFLLGGAFGFVAVWLRRWLSETPVFEAMRERRELAAELPLKRVLIHHAGSVALSMVMTWMLAASVMVTILMMPTLVQSGFHLPSKLAFQGNSVASLMLCVGCIAGGLAADRFGRGRSLLVGSLALLASTWLLYRDLEHGGAHFIMLYALTGLCVGVAAVVPVVMVAAFPPAVRFSGLSFAYNTVFALSGAVTPPLIAYLAHGLGPTAPAYYVAFASLVGVACALYLLATPRIFHER